MTNVIKYECRVTAVGPYVSEFTDAGIIVLFGQDAPEELAEFAILHDGTTLHEELAAGDTVCVDDSCFKVLAVGEVANSNLSNLGHLVLKFNGETEVEMPGDVCVEAGDLPEVTIGTVIRVEG
ncbi:MAG: PTS glucitol/sorbitol transporter subunit IIA [Anaerolineae bacterium]|nr:PTS glucitol/sorbitol transporter subunit IIA [Anaerolineae bacterium]